MALEGLAGGTDVDVLSEPTWPESHIDKDLIKSDLGKVDSDST